MGVLTNTRSERINVSTVDNRGKLTALPNAAAGFLNTIRTPINPPGAALL